MQHEQQPGELPRKEIRKIFHANHGAAHKLALELGVSRGTVSQVLRGKTTSKRILEAARRKALELPRPNEGRAA